MTKPWQTVCLCMIVKNEAPVIQACLESVRPLIDSWIVVDTGSTDGTQQLVRGALADLPGALHERPWVDFAHNRTEALALAREHGTYTLIIDADDLLSVPADYGLPVLTADSYTLDIDFGNTLYRRQQLVRAALPWRYEGVIHEFLTCDEAQTIEHLAGPRMVIGQGGARRRDPDTYKRDAAVLERALAETTSPFLRSRYTFYLAQSRRDSGQVEEAIDLYMQRAEQGFWVEERYAALLQAGRLMQQAGRVLDDVLVPLEWAADLVPTRAEALQAASFACRTHGDHARGTSFAEAAAALRMPEDGLFLERWVYEYGALDELAVNAYWIGEYRKSLDACLLALTYGAVPTSERPRFLANAHFAADKLAAGPKVH